MNKEYEEAGLKEQEYQLLMSDLKETIAKATDALEKLGGELHQVAEERPKDGPLVSPDGRYLEAPNEDVKVFILQRDGCIYERFYDSDAYCKDCLRNGSVFISYDTAYLATIRRMATQKLRLAAHKAWEDDGAEIDWDNHLQPKYEAHYYHREKEWVQRELGSMHPLSGICFPCQETCRDAIESLSEEERRALLGVV